MEENILRYLTDKLPQETAENKPINIENVVTSNFLPDMRLYTFDTVSNDGNYLIRYGGYPRTEQYDVGGIDVFTIDAIKKEQPTLSFYTMKINGHGFALRDLHQDENGRFYGIGNYIDESMNSTYYLIIFNNFVQDGYIQIRKFYSAQNMGISATENIIKVIKRDGVGEYYFLSISNNKIYKFKIDVSQGDSLEIYNFNESAYTGTSSEALYIIENSLFYIKSIQNRDNNENIISINEKKLVINIDEPPSGTYNFKNVRTINKGTNILVDSDIRDYKYYETVLVNNGSSYNLSFNIVNLNGSVRTFDTDVTFSGTEDLRIGYSENYMTVVDYTNKILRIFHYDYNDVESMKCFSETENFQGSLNQIQVLKQFNLETIVGLNTRQSLAYSTNIYSEKYTSDPHTNTNFLIPQYLNLYSSEVENVNDNDSIIYSRDAINRFLAGNQLTATFNVPNYLLNDTSIKTERVVGQTNLAISNELDTIQKNRFESLFLTYIQNLSIIDNTNGNNQQNMIASNRLSNSIWNKLDMKDSACLKIRVTDENGDYIIRDIDSITINDTEATLQYYVEGNVKKIEYLSNDLQTVYATYRCDLTVEEYGLLTEDNQELLTEDNRELLGATTNTIEQTIEVV